MPELEPAVVEIGDVNLVTGADAAEVLFATVVLADVAWPPDELCPEVVLVLAFVLVLSGVFVSVGVVAQRRLRATVPVDACLAVRLRATHVREESAVALAALGFGDVVVVVVVVVDGVLVVVDALVGVVTCVGVVVVTVGTSVVVVAAAGNDASSEIAYPARVRAVISVGATTADRCLASYSDVGPGLDLVAPGGGDDSSVLSDADCHPNRNLPDVYQMTFDNPAHPDRFSLPGGWYGTSMAAPEVSAAAAMVIASGVIGRHPSPDAVLDRLEQTAQPLGTGTPNVDYGYGLLDLGAATAPAASTNPTPPPYSIATAPVLTVKPSSKTDEARPPTRSRLSTTSVR